MSGPGSLTEKAKTYMALYGQERSLNAIKSKWSTLQHKVDEQTAFKGAVREATTTPLRQKDMNVTAGSRSNHCQLFAIVKLN
jgi:hypothetical protein